jgi:Spy/CpxP family protein refolding chaperone
MRLKINIFLWVFTLFCLSYSLVIAQDVPSSTGQAAGSAASAATGHEVSPAVQEKLQELSSALNLTGAQKEQIKPVLEQEVQQLRGIKQDGSLSENEKEMKMKQVHDSAQGQIQAVLTPEQQQKLAQMKENGMQH